MCTCTSIHKKLLRPQDTPEVHKQHKLDSGFKTNENTKLGVYEREADLGRIRGGYKYDQTIMYEILKEKIF